MKKKFSKCKNIILIPLGIISHEIYMNLFLASDAVIQRTSNPLCSSQAAALKKLCIVVLMPSAGYMDVEEMAKDMAQRKLGILLDWSDSKLSEKIIDLIDQDKQGKFEHIKENAKNEFYGFHQGENSCFKVIEKLAGF